jgi:hypothetical protein
VGVDLFMGAENTYLLKNQNAQNSKKAASRYVRGTRGANFLVPPEGNDPSEIPWRV